MCGRYTLHHSTSQVVMRFGVQETLTDVPERYNIAPTQPIVVVTENSPRILEKMQWGLVPSWAKDPDIAAKLINARGETLLEKPSFKNALFRRRCLIPTDGFYEWRKVGDAKQPMHIRRKDGELFAFAGLWEERRSPDGSLLRSCTIITVGPNELMASIHNRMPAILQPEDEAAWLNPSIRTADEVLSRLAPYPAAAMEAYPVSRTVNSPTVDNIECIQPLADDR